MSGLFRKVKHILKDAVKVGSVVGLGIILLWTAHTHYGIFLDDGIQAVIATPAFAVYVIGLIAILAIATNYLERPRIASALFAFAAAVIGVGYLLEPAGSQLMMSIVFGLGAVYSGFKSYTEG
ncbi:hypothetical protein [Natronolimnohabitans innermongolicus]|uniref:Uncharacterized protein n=1 Tax=Natronolimnohabitans innermongolicus JCM 12255 TaxID=1227499 RepID=L9XJ12_9EURY|nr:hypothetical protein [Natronolimnohabitans innermongolicus]ELY61577.1 hypothetical protein C493_01896 [Natronolimnohabitans innermongolicus JCM 12255]